ncbi:MAG: DUF3810 domain-containing protein [Flavobacteriaceae bacterium]
MMSIIKLHLRRRLLLGCSFFLSGIFLSKYVQNNHHLLEKSWIASSRNSIQVLFSALLNPIPFSVGDLLYGLLTLAIIRQLAKIRQQGLKTAVNFFVWSGLLYLIFQVQWGFNYLKPPVFPIEAPYKSYDQKALIRTANYLVEQTNTIHTELTRHPDSVPKIPYTKAEIRTLIEAAPYFQSFDTSVQLKESLWSLVLSYMGYAGYVNPWTLEAQINARIPKMSYTVTAAHELQHQLGIAPENEANFGAFLATTTHPDRWISFTGYNFALRYTLSAVWKTAPEKAKIIQAQIHPGIIKGFREQAEFWNTYDNPLEDYFKQSYDQFLKAQGQPLGIRSYGAMVQLIIQHFEKSATEVSN